MWDLNSVCVFSNIVMKLFGTWVLLLREKKYDQLNNNNLSLKQGLLTVMMKRVKGFRENVAAELEKAIYLAEIIL